MTTKNEQLHSIQARIEELQNTIAEKEEHIMARSRQLKDGLTEELSPVKIVRKHPFLAAGMTFAAGLLLTKTIRGKQCSCNSCSPAGPDPAVSSQRNGALYGIGLDVLRAAKDLGFNYLQRYIDKKIT